jgi:hypothetical protein
MWKWLKSYLYRTLWHPLPISPDRIPETIKDDMRADARAVVLSQPDLVFLSPPKKPRHKKMKPKRAVAKKQRETKKQPVVVLQAAKPDKAEFLEILRKKKNNRSLETFDPTTTMPPATGVARCNGHTIFRQGGETLRGFHDRVKAIVGTESYVEWIVDYEPLSYGRKILEDHMRRPLKSQLVDDAPHVNEAVKNGHLLPVDLQNWNAGRGVLH